MAGEGAPPATDLTSLSFRDEIWLNTYRPDRNNIFEYFVNSPFYDRTCSNEQLRMRSIHPLDMSQLSKMTGIEYVLQEVQEPNLFVLRKQRRESPEKVNPISAYYVLDGTVYQAPLLYNVVCSRVARAVHHISSAFSQVTSKLEKIGYDDEDEEENNQDEPAKVVHVKQVMRIDCLMGNVLRKLPPAPPPPAPPAFPGGVPEQAPDSKAPTPQQEAPPAAAAPPPAGPPLKKAKLEKR